MELSYNEVLLHFTEKLALSKKDPMLLLVCFL